MDIHIFEGIDGDSAQHPNITTYSMQLSINQSINQKISQSVNQSVSQSINQLIALVNDQYCRLLRADVCKTRADAIFCCFLARRIPLLLLFILLLLQLSQ